jgi:hypothetical protein
LKENDMIRTSLRAAVLAAACLAGMPGAEAAVLPVEIDPTIAFASTGDVTVLSVAAIPPFFPATVGASADALAATGFGATDQPFSLTGDGFETSTFAVGTALSGSTVDLSFQDEDTIEIVYGGLSGGFAAVFGDRVLLTLTGDGDFAPDALGEFTTFTASVAINPVTQVIPVPAALPLLLGALALTGAVARRRT